MVNNNYKALFVFVKSTGRSFFFLLRLNIAIAVSGPHSSLVGSANAPQTMRLLPLIEQEKKKEKPDVNKSDPKSLHDRGDFIKRGQVN